MVEPTETESPETLDQAAQVFLDILAEAKAEPGEPSPGPPLLPGGTARRGDSGTVSHPSVFLWGITGAGRDRHAAPFICHCRRGHRSL